MCKTKLPLWTFSLSLEHFFAPNHAICSPCFDISHSYLKQLLASNTDLINGNIILAVLYGHWGLRSSLWTPAAWKQPELPIRDLYRHETGTFRIQFLPVREKLSKIYRLTYPWKCLCMCDSIQISFPQLSHFNSGIIMLLCFTRLSLRLFTNCFEGGKCWVMTQNMWLWPPTNDNGYQFRLRC